ncbi:MAG: elongation factor Ts [Patescibacteria group bacterium]|nr:elongation factor Ts [Patescibacteria group bacterium]
MINIDKIKQLRGDTGVSIMECKKALIQADGDLKKAKEILRTLGMELADKKSSRDASEGIIATYVHFNKKIGVLLDIRCESDFVAKSKEFEELAHEICLQIAATKPLFLRDKDIPEEFLDSETRIYKEQFKDSGKPQKIVDEIINGKLKKYKSKNSLLSQVWIKDETLTIADLINKHIASSGENITAKKFVRYEI